MFEGLPTTVRVGPFDYTIEVHDLIETDIADDPTGLFAFSELKIKLRRAQPSPSFAADTVLHEILHAIWRHHGLKRPKEETAVSALSCSLIQLIQDNPELIAWIMRFAGRKTTPSSSFASSSLKST